ncbi:unnamed protein product [Phytophthora fragariaefolia]|uniref:Unnamed protein product n=1 Tax=Phytophthora fragariaefolia TaxID=1490495 RepID=A0A9W7CQ24_9STRA|nr:unnamed protein product [Phytophthora fragariaefolia]
MGWQTLCDQADENPVTKVVEAIKNMHIDPNGHIEEPVDLFQREDGTTSSVLKEAYRHMFVPSTSSSFFACLPRYFWQQILHETNNYASVNAIPINKPFTMHELLLGFGIGFTWRSL